MSQNINLLSEIQNIDAEEPPVSKTQHTAVV